MVVTCERVRSWGWRLVRAGLLNAALTDRVRGSTLLDLTPRTGETMSLCVAEIWWFARAKQLCEVI